MNHFTDLNFYRTLLDSLLEGVYTLDAERRITFWNRGAEELTGCPSSEVLGRHCFEILHHSDSDGQSLCHTPQCQALCMLQTGENSERIVYIQHREGYRVPMLTRVRPMRSTTGEVIGVVTLFSDATHHIVELERIKELKAAALLDPLTGAGNRRYGEMMLEDRLGHFQRYGLGFAAAFLDIDKFKTINDDYGHPAGDAVLRTVSETLRRSTRASDTVVRWGGEEFLLLLPGSTGEQARDRVERLCHLVAGSHTPFRGRTLRITVSAGVVSVPPVVQAAELLSQADDLMYQAKRAGRNRVFPEARPSM